MDLQPSERRKLAELKRSSQQSTGDDNLLCRWSGLESVGSGSETGLQLDEADLEAV